MTKEQLRARFPNASESFLQKNAQEEGKTLMEVFGLKPEWRSAATKSGNSKVISPNDCVNQLETDFLAWLRIEYPHDVILVKPHAFRLSSEVHYTPDFMRIGVGNAEVICYETKGHHRFYEKGVMKLKMAAAIYPYIRWVLVQRPKRGEPFKFRTIKP